MNLHWIDWTIIAVFLFFLVAVIIYTKRLNKGVADFLVANRCAGRYILSISEGMSGLGAITFIAYFEMYYKTGFTAAWWMMMLMPVRLFIAISGWVVYRFRETRAMTMAQFFEMRYSRNFRVFCGILAWVSGVVNMGIFPAVTANFFIYFCGLPQTFSIFGMVFSTFVTIMIFELSIALLFITLGGMVIVAITDFLQGIFCNIAFLVITVALFFKFDWNQIISACQGAPQNASMINPFKTSEVQGFDFGFFLILVFTTVYSIRVWQGNQGYNAAAKNAHEAKMAGIIGNWRGQLQVLLIMLLPICAFTLMHCSDFSTQAHAVQKVISGIGGDTVREQMLVPIALTHILPIGILGIFGAVMLAAAISTDDTYLHSWGSIFIQDVVLPFRKKSFTPVQHIWLLRLSIFFVALCVFLFSLIFKQNDYILMYMMMTGAIYAGGAGAVIIGGLYWKHGSTAGAWGGMIVGGVLAFGGLVLREIWPNIVPTLMEWFPSCSNILANHAEKFPYDGVKINFFAIVCGISAYLGLSLWDWLIRQKPAFNINRMLYRGEYAIKGEHEHAVTLPPTGFKTLLPDKEFSKSDKFLHFSLIIWTVAWSLFFIIVTVYQLLFGISEQWWIDFWYFDICLTALLGIVTTVWFIFGGVFDIRYLFRKLESTSRDITDDGRVLHGDKENDCD